MNLGAGDLSEAQLSSDTSRAEAIVAEATPEAIGQSQLEEIKRRLQALERVSDSQEARMSMVWTLFVVLVAAVFGTSFALLIKGANTPRATIGNKQIQMVEAIESSPAYDKILSPIQSSLAEHRTGVIMIGSTLAVKSASKDGSHLLVASLSANAQAALNRNPKFLTSPSAALKFLKNHSDSELTTLLGA